MQRLIGAMLLTVTLPAAAGAAQLRVEITYTNGHIVSGPLTTDLDALPSKVQASFTLSKATPGVYDLAEVVESSLVFGDGAWGEDDLESLSISLLPTDERTLAIVALTYATKPIDTPATSDRIARNFPLEITGTDAASGVSFYYIYDMSSQRVRLIPEPAGLVPTAVGLAWFFLAIHRRKGATCTRYNPSAELSYEPS